eukprot:750024-Hanusia_phi.AAC.7
MAMDYPWLAPTPPVLHHTPSQMYHLPHTPSLAHPPHTHNSVSHMMPRPGLNHPGRPAGRPREALVSGRQHIRGLLGLPGVGRTKPR